MPAHHIHDIRMDNQVRTLIDGVYALYFLCQSITHLSLGITLDLPFKGTFTIFLTCVRSYLQFPLSARL